VGGGVWIRGTSSKLYFFQRNSVVVFSAYHLLLRQGVAASNRLTSINLILAAITYSTAYTALSSALFWCNLGTIGQSCPFAKRASTIFLGFFKRRDALLADRAGAVQP